MFSPKKWLNNIVEQSYLPTDDADLRLKKVALTLVPLIIGPAAFIWGFIYILLGHPYSGAIPLSYSIISFFSLLYFFRSKRTQFIQYSQLTLVLILPFLLMWSLGGFNAGSMVMIWAIFAPIATVMFLDKKTSLIWFLLYFALIVISVFINDYVNSTIKHLPELAIEIFYLLNLGTGSAGLFLLVSYSIKEEKRSNKADLRIAASAFDVQQGLIITNARGVILRANRSFYESTGYTAEEVIGKTPNFLKSDRHDAEFFACMLEILTKTGSWQGEIWNRRKNGEVFPELLTISSVKGDDGEVSHYVSSYLDITDRKASEDKILYLAFYDSLTKLPNRQMMFDRLQRALVLSSRNKQKGAVLFIDMDNFKTINDTLGHAIGDLFLKQVAGRLTSCVRASDTVSRLGGDEFVVILESLSKNRIEAAEAAKQVGENILASLNKIYQLDTHALRSSASIGASMYGEELKEAEELIKQADIAMYQAKKAGRNELRFFDPQMQLIINSRAALEDELYKAIDHNQLQLYFQIQVNDKHHPIGAEVLLRWFHPELGMISPAQFIPLAEETGQILSIGKWVLESTCAQLKIWSSEEKTRKLVLAVNISARQFQQPDFVEQIQNCVLQHGINPKLLKLELTESMLLEDSDKTVNTMKSLKNIGLQLSLDDFGTGYSSLKYLKLLPLNQIKIDQSFVRDIASDTDDAAIVQTIIAMSNSLGLEVIAEGVETTKQCEFLKLSGCYNFQGYLFGKPIPIDQFMASINIKN